MRYLPPPNFFGATSFVYVFCSEPGACRRATVHVSVRPVNDDPIARNDVLRVAEDAPVQLDVLANDTDADGIICTSLRSARSRSARRLSRMIA